MLASIRWLDNAMKVVRWRVQRRQVESSLVRVSSLRRQPLLDSCCREMALSKDIVNTFKDGIFYDSKKMLADVRTSATHVRQGFARMTYSGTLPDLLASTHWIRHGASNPFSALSLAQRPAST